MKLVLWIVVSLPLLLSPVAAGAQAPVPPAVAPWHAAPLEQALDYARGQRSSALVVVQGGKTIAERYWQPDVVPGSPYRNMVGTDAWDGAGPVEDVASLQKSVVSVLVGMAQARGMLSVENPVSSHVGAGWSDASAEHERDVRIRHLLSMTSGLSPSLAFEAPAGTRWRYNTRAYSRLV